MIGRFVEEFSGNRLHCLKECNRLLMFYRLPFYHRHSTLSVRWMSTQLILTRWWK